MFAHVYMTLHGFIILSTIFFIPFHSLGHLQPLKFLLKVSTMRVLPIRNFTSRKRGTIKVDLKKLPPKDQFQRNTLLEHRPNPTSGGTPRR